MRKSWVPCLAAANLMACGQSGEEPGGANRAAANVAAAEKPRPTYCFFKDAETKGWAAKTDKSGNVVVTGNAYRSDPRYQAKLTPAIVNGTSAEISPTIVQNDTGFASPENWWPLSQAIPNSQAVTSVTVKCGARTLATLSVRRNK